MADRPSSYPSWATNVLDEPVQIGGSTVLVTNKVEPTTEFKSTGLKARENFARPYLNFQFNLLDEWVQNFDTRTSIVGKVELTSDAGRTVTDYANEFGGTWTSHGSTTLAGLTVYIFERTA